MPNLQGFSSYICYIFFYLLNSAAVDTEGNRIWRSGAIWCRCTRHHVFIRLCQLITADGARAVFVKDPVRRIGLGVGSVFQMGLSINGWVQKKLSGWFISWKIMENPSINGWFGPPSHSETSRKIHPVRRQLQGNPPTWRLPSTHPPQCTFSCGKSPDKRNEIYRMYRWMQRNLQRQNPRFVIYFHLPSLVPLGMKLRKILKIEFTGSKAIQGVQSLAYPFHHILLGFSPIKSCS